MSPTLLSIEKLTDGQIKIDAYEPTMHWYSWAQKAFKLKSVYRPHEGIVILRYSRANQNSLPNSITLRHYLHSVVFAANAKLESISAMLIDKQKRN